MGWRTFTYAAGQRVDPSRSVADSDHDVGRKVRHAEKEGVKIVDLPEGEDHTMTSRKRSANWSKTGPPTAKAKITLWRDWQHRRYFCAQDTHGEICAIVGMAQLALDKGYQVKYSLDFPQAPSGTIEYITLHAVKAAAAAGSKTITFGASATNELLATHNLGGAKIKVLSHMYQNIAAQFKLAQKSDFGQKLGAEEDLVFIEEIAPRAPVFEAIVR
ncbi:MAG: hypothetical protein Q9195_005821 [Heterodermia aff. obscurata]